MRTWAGRVSGRADRRLLVALAEATQALVEHQDALIDRISTYESLNSDLRITLSEDLVRLRAEVVHLRRLTEPSEADGRE